MSSTVKNCAYNISLDINFDAETIKNEMNDTIEKTLIKLCQFLQRLQNKVHA